jgi:hypothetical protein
MILRCDDTLRGADDFVGELALARRARRRYLQMRRPRCAGDDSHTRAGRYSSTHAGTS